LPKSLRYRQREEIRRAARTFFTPSQIEHPEMNFATLIFENKSGCALSPPHPAEKTPLPTSEAAQHRKEHSNQTGFNRMDL
jgi:hypothetical protein